MSKFKEIERRFEVGYTPSVYGTVSNARLQMHNDLKYLINEFKKLNIHSVSNRLETTCAKTEPLIIEMNKDNLVQLYNFAYEQAVKTGKVDELKEIDAKLNGC